MRRDSVWNNFEEEKMKIHEFSYENEMTLEGGDYHQIFRYMLKWEKTLQRLCCFLETCVTKTIRVLWWIFGCTKGASQTA